MVGRGNKPIRIGPELKKRLLTTALLVVLFRLLANIPVFAVDQGRLNALLADNPLLGGIDLLAGGDVLTRFSVVGAGVFPVVLATLLVTVASWSVPALKKLRTQGEAGTRRLKLYERALTVLLAFVIAWAITQTLSREIGLLPGGVRWFTPGSVLPALAIIGLFTVGSLVSAAISDLITKKGVYQGEGVLLLTGAVQSLSAKGIAGLKGWPPPREDVVDSAIVAFGALVAAALCTVLVTSCRRVPIQMGRLRSPRGPVRNHVPLRLVFGGILPVSAAIGVLALIGISQEFFAVYLRGQELVAGHLVGGWITPENGWYWLSLAVLIVGFTYVSNFSLLWAGPTGEGWPIAEQLKRQGAFVPGVRPGTETQEYFSRLMHRLTPIGAVALGLLAVGVPWSVYQITQRDMTVANLSLFVAVQHLGGLWRHVAVQYRSETLPGLLR